uniref:Zinc finger protein 511 n=1 Tax=Marmota marmota marmota TaxID=9994 RepID=A0A8C5YWM5_MARMA
MWKRDILPPATHDAKAGEPEVERPSPLPRPWPRLKHQQWQRGEPDGDVQRHLYLQDVLTQVAEEPERSRVPEFTCQVPGCCQVFAALEDYQHHYNMLHGNACSLCSRAFPSGHLLDAHILEWHDSLFQILAERQDMYQCLIEGCPEKFKTSRDRKDHMVRFHLYPADFRFDKPKTSRGPATRRSDADLSTAALRDEGDAMEVCSEPAAAPPAPVGEKRTYIHRSVWTSS